MKRNPNLPRVPRTFLIRVLVDGAASQTTIHGQISEPTNDEGWQATFASAEELWTVMRGRLKLRRKIRLHTTERSHA